MSTPSVRTFAYYLPQFHPVPENDQAWGPGFTEWNNVVKAEPLFDGHAQPRLPRDLGFYDLRVPETRQAQADLARANGIDGFIYYHYWFHGRQVLERPFNDVLDSGQPDFPFALCWANEDWRSMWDGRTGEVLLEQNYSEDDDREHMRWFARAMHDARYIRIDGRPLLIVHRVTQLPNPGRTAEIWREEARNAGVGEIYLAYSENMDFVEGGPSAIGFDASVDFAPNWQISPGQFRGDLELHDYLDTAAAMLSKPDAWHRRYPCVTPGFDNTPRKGEHGYITTGANPDLYKGWLASTIQNELAKGHEDVVVFVNAWNEWAEGAILEPCSVWGDAYLQAHKAAVEQGRLPIEVAAPEQPEHVEYVEAAPEVAVEPVAEAETTDWQESVSEWNEDDSSETTDEPIEWVEPETVVAWTESEAEHEFPEATESEWNEEDTAADAVTESVDAPAVIIELTETTDADESDVAPVEDWDEHDETAWNEHAVWSQNDSDNSGREWSESDAPATDDEPEWVEVGETEWVEESTTDIAEDLATTVESVADESDSLSDEHAPQVEAWMPPTTDTADAHVAYVTGEPSWSSEAYSTDDNTTTSETPYVSAAASTPEVAVSEPVFSNAPTPVAEEAAAEPALTPEPAVLQALATERTGLTVSVLTNGGAEPLMATLRSALDTCVGMGAIDFLVIDNATKDETPALLEALGDSVRSLRTQTALTPQAAWMLAKQAARGEYVLLLSNDVVLTKDWLEPVIMSLATDPMCNAACPAQSFNGQAFPSQPLSSAAGVCLLVRDTTDVTSLTEAKYVPESVVNYAPSPAPSPAPTA